MAPVDTRVKPLEPISPVKKELFANTESELAAHWTLLIWENLGARLRERI